eukprot:scaffold665288_cov50-Prasinocladus_malaysianus.AAC.1
MSIMQDQSENGQIFYELSNSAMFGRTRLDIGNGRKPWHDAAKRNITTTAIDYNTPARDKSDTHAGCIALNPSSKKEATRFRLVHHPRQVLHTVDKLAWFVSNLSLH